MPREKLSAIQGDITALDVDAIVNAANPSLLGGGGVSGAIHRRAGPELAVECQAIGGCKTGEAKLTLGYHLPARFIIHAVGPVWHGGGNNEEALLAACYRAVMDIAAEQKLRSIAFPAISTGIYGFPAEKAAKIAVATVLETIGGTELEQVIFCCFSKDMLAIYQGLLSAAPK